MTTPEQAQDLIGHLNALRFYSYANVAIDVVALALTFIPFLTNSKWKALVNVGGCVFVFHGITYSCLLSRIVLVAFPQSRAVNLSGVARENQRKKSLRGNLSKCVVGKMFGRRESDLKAGRAESGSYNPGAGQRMTQNGNELIATKMIGALDRGPTGTRILDRKELTAQSEQIRST